MRGQALEDGLRGGAFGHQDGGRAHRQREGQAVAQAIGEEQLGGRKRHVVLADAQHGLGIEFGRVPEVAVGVDHALGLAGRARRIEPEGDFIGQRAGRRRDGRLGDQGLESMLARRRPRRLRDDDVLDIVLAAVQRGPQLRQQAGGDDQRPRPAMGGNIGVVVRRQQGVDGHRHDAGVQRAQKGHRPVHRVVHHHEDAFFAAQAQLAQGAAEAGHALGQLAVAEPALVIDIGCLGGARRVQRGQMAGEIQLVGAVVHACLLEGRARGLMALMGGYPAKAGVAGRFSSLAGAPCTALRR